MGASPSADCAAPPAARAGPSDRGSLANVSVQPLIELMSGPVRTVRTLQCMVHGPSVFNMRGAYLPRTERKEQCSVPQLSAPNREVQSYE